MTEIRLHMGDLPDLLHYDVAAVAIDTETLGLNPYRDRLCVVQLSPGNGTADVVQIAAGQKNAPNIVRLLEDPGIIKIFHFARFDLAVLERSFGVMPMPVFCTKIASRLVRTYTNQHSLRELCNEFLDIVLSKQQQSSDWGADVLTEPQKQYAASDVLYLHRLKNNLEKRLVRENRLDLAESCFGFLPIRAKLDLAGWYDQDIFAHN
ncbi:MAG: ribonuclease D [Candidatus Tokpelaia sp. JSC085]|nr:MAG: ribonuclease D [Candidatus Tokpelaia sp. JSC085]